MPDPVKIYLELSTEINRLLLQNNLGIHQVLQRADIDADIAHTESLLIGDETVNTRNIVTTIAISAVSLSLVAPALINVINALKNDAEVVRETYFRLEPVVDPKTGEVLRDHQDNPIVNKVPQSELSQVRPQHSKTKVSLDIANVLHLGFSFETKEFNE